MVESAIELSLMDQVIYLGGVVSSVIGQMDTLIPRSVSMVTHVYVELL